MKTKEDMITVENLLDIYLKSQTNDIADLAHVYRKSAVVLRNIVSTAKIAFRDIDPSKDAFYKKLLEERNSLSESEMSNKYSIKKDVVRQWLAEAESYETADHAAGITNDQCIELIKSAKKDPHSEMIDEISAKTGRSKEECKALLNRGYEALRARKDTKEYFYGVAQIYQESGSLEEAESVSKLTEYYMRVYLLMSKAILGERKDIIEACAKLKRIKRMYSLTQQQTADLLGMNRHIVGYLCTAADAFEMIDFDIPDSLSPMSKADLLKKISDRVRVDLLSKDDIRKINEYDLDQPYTAPVKAGSNKATDKAAVNDTEPVGAKAADPAPVDEAPAEAHCSIADYISVDRDEGREAEADESSSEDILCEYDDEYGYYRLLANGRSVLLMHAESEMPVFTDRFIDKDKKERFLSILKAYVRKDKKKCDVFIFCSENGLFPLDVLNMATNTIRSKYFCMRVFAVNDEKCVVVFTDNIKDKVNEKFIKTFVKIPSKNEVTKYNGMRVMITANGRSAANG